MNIKEYLDSRNLTQKELADILDISEGSIAHYCHARRTPTLLIALKIRAYTKNKVGLEDLLSDEELADLQSFCKSLSK